MNQVRIVETLEQTYRVFIGDDVEPKTTKRFLEGRGAALEAAWEEGGRKFGAEAFAIVLLLQSSHQW